MNRTYINWTIAGLAVVGLALVAVATAPALGAGCGGCGTRAPDKGVAGPKAPAAEGPTAPASQCGGCGGVCGGCGTKAADKSAAASGHMQAVAKLNDSLAAALKAAKAGDAKTAATEIAKAQQLLAGMQKRMASRKPVAGPEGKTGKIVNARCPIMGSKVNPDKIPAKLIREFNGKKVGFCCGGCPAAWDKLADSAKAAKLKGAM